MEAITCNNSFKDINSEIGGNEKFADRDEEIYF